MAGPLAVRGEESPVSSRSLQHTFRYYPRVQPATITVDVNKCHAIVQDRYGVLRQCQRAPTNTGEDGSVCSTKHTFQYGKVGEPTIIEEQ